MNDRTSFYPELAKKIAPRRGQASRRAPAGSRRGVDDADRRRRPRAARQGEAVRLGHADAEAAARQARPAEVHSHRGARASRRAAGPRLRRLGHLPRQRVPGGVQGGRAPAGHARRLEVGARGHPPVAGGLRAVVVQEPRRAERQEGHVEDGPRRCARPRHRGLPQDLGRRARRHGVVRLDRGLRAARARARDARGVREGAQGELARHPAVDDLRVRRHPRGNPVRERRAEPLRGRAGADGSLARAGRPDRRQGLRSQAAS